MEGRASLTRRLLAAVIIAVVAAASAWPLYNLINVYVIHGNDIIVRVYRDSAIFLTPITNASLTAIVFYPSPVNGSTVFQVVYNGSHQGTFYISPKALINWSLGWLKRYGPKAYLWLEPSIIFGVAYPVSNGSDPYVVTQLFAEPFNLSYPLEGRGAIFNLVITRPLMVARIRAPEGSAKAAGRPATTTTTSTTLTSILEGCSRQGTCLWLVPHVLAYYPSSSNVAPISIATIVASWNETSPKDLLPLNLVTQAGFKMYASSGAGIGFLFGAVPGSELSSAFEELGYDLGRLADVISSISVNIAGPSITLSSSSLSVSSANGTEAFMTPMGRQGNVGQLYVLGQVAFVNWTLEVYRLGECLGTVSWSIGPVLTALVVNEVGSVAVPVVYSYVTNDTCANIWLWAEGQASPRAYEAWISSVCPYPYLPAPVNWTVVYYLMKHMGQASGSVMWNVQYSSLTGASNYVGLPIDVGFTLEFILASVPGVDIPDWAALLLSAISIAPWTYNSKVLLSSEWLGAEAGGSYVINVTGGLDISYEYSYSQLLSTQTFRLPPPVIYGTLLNAS